MKKQFLIVIFCLCAVMPLCCSGSAWAIFGEDLEKPRPEFSKKDKTITAKLVPRAKTTSVWIDFEVAGATLANVTAMDFKDADRPEVYRKDFRCELFMVDITGVPKGGEAIVSIRSPFFTSSTQYWIFNEHASVPWMNSEAENVAVKERVHELVIKVKDGGMLDSDGQADGKIFLVGGPRDSFWGYVLGTLFIRFFGVFIVLSILMAGMMFSGSLFQAAERKSAKPEPQPVPTPIKTIPEPPTSIPVETQISPEIVAVVAAALSIELSEPAFAAAIAVSIEMNASKTELSECRKLTAPESSPWTQQGRSRIMNDRYLTIKRS